MMTMMMNFFLGIFEQRKALSLISSRDHCQRFSPLQISDTLREESKSAKNLSTDFVEWSFVVVFSQKKSVKNNKAQHIYMHVYTFINVYIQVIYTSIYTYTEKPPNSGHALNSGQNV